MTFVTDTHPLVFFASSDPRRMGRAARRIFQRAEEGRDRIHVPVVCFFELAMLLELGRVRQTMPFDRWHELVAAQPGFSVEPLVFDDVRVARSFASLVDPFDRLIAGVADRLGVALITADERIRTSGLVRTVW